MKRHQNCIQIICADPILVQQYIAELQPCCGPQDVLLARSAAEAHRQFANTEPVVILFDESAAEGDDNLSLETTVAMLTEAAPAVVVVAPERRWELTFLLSSGAMDFVARTGHFVPVAAGLVERRIRLGEDMAGLLGCDGERQGEDFGEILRHEVNNPLTGILGNAELLLARGDRLPPADVARLKTIAELAVRLRDTVRRLSCAYSVRNG
jgi:signal transduction histidine kinase